MYKQAIVHKHSTNNLNKGNGFGIGIQHQELNWSFRKWSFKFHVLLLLRIYLGLNIYSAVHLNFIYGSNKCVPVYTYITCIDTYR